ncbi:MAG: efflux transporter outer membrane subunit, partial [Sinobacteraceae bacterium]|nr:efflux transporter outer membrane subunit [Nevskiaceae bacterium]
QLAAIGLMRALVVLASCAALAACAVGPTYRRPAAPTVTSYTAEPSVGRIAAASSVAGPAAGPQVLVSGAAVSPHWWAGFGSPALDQLVNQALAHNPDLSAAKATLEAAQDEVQAARGAFYPHATLGLGASRTRSSGAAGGGAFGPSVYNLYTGEVSVGYNPDVFGATRYTVRSQQALADLARDRLDAVRLSIAGNVVATAIDVATLDAEIATLQRTVGDQRQVLDLVRQQYLAGAIARFDVLTQQSLLASSQAQLTQLRQARDTARHLLATLVGEFPAASRGLHSPALASLELPKRLPLSLPTSLVRDRPDILAAEAQLRAANAEVGVAIAHMYPSFNISAAFGFGANLASSLFDPASQLWNLAASLAAPLFEGGELRAQKHAAQADYRRVFANYQATVLGAFRNVADVLRALEHDSAFLESRANAMRAAHQALTLVTAQYRAGGVDYLDLLDSQTRFQKGQIAYVKAQAQRYADTAALYVALGGGQWTDSAAGSPPTGRVAVADTAAPAHSPH